MKIARTRTTADHTIFGSPPTHYRDVIACLWRLQKADAETGRLHDTATITVTGMGQVIAGHGDPNDLARLLAAAALEEARGYLLISPSTLVYEEDLSIAAANANGIIRFIATWAERTLWEPPAA